MYHVLEASDEVEIDGERRTVERGAVLWVPGDAVHGVFCGEREGRFEDVICRFKET